MDTQATEPERVKRPRQGDRGALADLIEWANALTWPVAAFETFLAC